MKIICREKFAVPFRLWPEDAIKFDVHNDVTTTTGWLWKKAKTQRQVVFTYTYKAQRQMTVTEAVVFQTEFEGRQAYGIMVIEQ